MELHGIPLVCAPLVAVLVSTCQLLHKIIDNILRTPTTVVG